ncbi:SufS family cysteine desulfurase [Candidatus Uhrbacteria bacterium]|nr:SufS family cysteine desulfurase [Candidatus Uhrbacteria bacterium]
MHTAASIRSQFPILKRKINNNPLAYLDNAATTQKPQSVVKAITDFYTQYNANVHRGMHALSEQASTAYEDGRERIARFFGATPEEFIFTRGTSDSINIVARMLEPRLKPNDEILATQMEHHSNLVPWQQLVKRTGAVLKILPITDEGRWDMDALERILSGNTKIVAVNHCSNVLGTINPVAAMVRAAHQAGALVVVDGAQSSAHLPLNLRSLDVDFYAVSSHKMYGPTGMGGFYGKHEILELLEPVSFGGDMIRSVEAFDATWNDLPWKFEPGTPHIAGAIGWAAAVDWMQSVGWDTLEAQERELTQYALDTLKQVPGITIHGPNTAVNRLGVISMTMDGVHPHDIATLLDREGVAVRSGTHCAMPLMTRLGIPATARASFACYNIKKEVDQLAKALQTAWKMFHPTVTVQVPAKNLWQR